MPEVTGEFRRLRFARVVRPDQRAHFGVEPHCVEGGQILKRPEQRTMQRRPEVDTLLGSIGERHQGGVRPDDTEPHYTVNRMRHHGDRLLRRV